MGTCQIEAFVDIGITEAREAERAKYQRRARNRRSARRYHHFDCRAKSLAAMLPYALSLLKNAAACGVATRRFNQMVAALAIYPLVLAPDELRTC